MNSFFWCHLHLRRACVLCHPHSIFRIKVFENLLTYSLLSCSVILNSILRVKVWDDFMANSCHYGSIVLNSIFWIEVLHNFMVNVILMPVLDLDVWLPRVNILDGLPEQWCLTLVHKFYFRLKLLNLTLNRVRHLSYQLINVFIANVIDELLIAFGPLLRLLRLLLLLLLGHHFVNFIIGHSRD